MWDFPLFPDRASTIAGHVDAVYFAVLGVVFFFTALICFLVLYFAVKYRRWARIDRSNPITHNNKLETAWIVIPLLISIAIFAGATHVFFEIYNPPRDATDIYVIGKQWMWKIQHPQGKREINELHVPVGRPFRLIMTSEDVIHSFYIPAFRIKQDVLPGRLTSEWFQPTRVGKYHLFCAEYCGLNHSRMIGSVYVMEPSDYEIWLKGGPAGPGMATTGERLFVQYHCSGCHGANSEFRAPKLEGVFGGPVPIQSGKEVRFVTADDRYIRDSILLPQSQVVAGFEPVMPSYKDVIPEDDLLQIIEYIKSIGRKERAER